MVKEATRGLKQIHEENIQTLKWFKIGIIFTYVTYSVSMIVFFWPSFTNRCIWLTLFSSIISSASYSLMSHMSQSTFNTDARGNKVLTDTGLDLNIGGGGVAEHAKDLIIVCCGVQWLTILHNGFWFLLLLIPSRLFHLLWVNVLAPWIFDPNQEPEVNEKKQKKMERRQKRMANAGR